MRKTTPANVPASIRKLRELLDVYDIPPNWELLLIGDGSGCHYGLEVGWAGVMLERRTGIWHTLVGGQNQGTITMAEIFPAWQLLRWHRYKMWRRDRAATDLMRTHILCDNTSVVGMGNRDFEHHRCPDLWAAFWAIADQRYQVRFHHIDRPIDLHISMDLLSVSAREYMQAFRAEDLPDPANSLMA